MGALTRLGDYISTEQGFRRASLVGFGIPAAAIGAWVFSDYDAAWLLVIPGAAIAAYVWATVMWKLVFREIFAQKQAAAGRTGSRVRDKPSGH
ncbi:hypothetical protein [uncultured Methylibium sp.]|uniref:hypothetical protein n=1 Tax=uncultured Methylibium sp. TaxID=381093 RepID=UPI0025F9F9E2|nr:hypothetical protein [uncultured Methylibium sp.]